MLSGGRKVAKADSPLPTYSTAWAQLDISREAKGRSVFLGRLARQAVRAYLRLRGSAAGPLFLNRSGCRLAYAGLRSILTRRAKRAGLDQIPSPHDFRRAFALACLRNGMDLLSLQRLLGHTDLSVAFTPSNLSGVSGSSRRISAFCGVLDAVLSTPSTMSKEVRCIDSQPNGRRKESNIR